MMVRNLSFSVIHANYVVNPWTIGLKIITLSLGKYNLVSSIRGITKAKAQYYNAGSSPMLDDYWRRRMKMKTKFQKLKSENEIQIHFKSQKFPAVYAKLDVETLEP